MTERLLRPFKSDDAAAIRELTKATLDAYRRRFGETADRAADVTELADLAKTGSVFVAQQGADIVGAVGYTPPGVIEHPLFSPSWALIRMLVVAAPVDHSTVTSSLIARCIAQAESDKAEAISVYSWPSDIMFEPDFRRAGFREASVAPELHGNLHALLVRKLGPQSD